jgi:hypothetical protein
MQSEEESEGKLNKEVAMPISAKDYDDFTYEGAEKVPTRGAGVYVFADRNYEIVQIGSVSGAPLDLQLKLFEHLRSAGPLRAKVRYFWAEPTDNYKAKEQELLEEYKQAHSGALPEGNR